MAPRAAATNYSYMADSASEDEMAADLNAFPTPDSNTENKAPTRRGRGKTAQKAEPALATKATAKSKTTARRASGASVLGVKKQNAAVMKKTGTKRGRKALEERPHVNVSDTEEVEEFVEEDEVAAPVEEAKPAKRGRPARARKAHEESVVDVPPAKRTRKEANKESATKTAPKAKATAKSRATKRVPEPEPEPEPEPVTIPETQPDPDDSMDIEESIEVDEIPETMPPPPRPTARRAQQPAPRRAGSASDSERDPVLRRKLGDMQKKFESMTTKYETLKEVAASAKESNFDRLKRKTDQTAKDQDAIIKTLKQQLSEQQSRSADLSSLKKEMAKLEKENSRLSSENNTLTTSLTAAQNENKSLSSKLAAARSSAPPEAKNIPGSAIKPRSTGVVLPGAAEAAKDAQIRQAKVDLYSDLTNLVIVGIKKNDDGEDVYDCLQTGRNGTLHFQLRVATDSDSYDEAEIIYNPLFNEQRDKDLLDLLPDYLTEEIGFPRNQAPKFYMKVVDSMSKKIILEE